MNKSDFKHKLPIIKQKFMRGDIVRLNEPVTKYSHPFYHKERIAIVEGSYSDECRQYSKPENGFYISKGYSLFFPENGSSSAWHEEKFLTLIEQRKLEDVYERTL